ncbi:MAG: hypothetical protein HGB30_13110, partial [Holophagaceae bacterium]|nr:hypothetical protein [Holophagaceae bacterium]
VPSSLYTATKHAAGSTVAGILSKAVIYVYPRVNPVPVLTKASETLVLSSRFPTGKAYAQAQNVLVDATDANILTDGTGFKYKLKAIPATLSGTVLIRFIAQNYGYVSDTNYKIDTTAILPIQVNTATASQRLSGDNCIDCHGLGNFAGHNARHSVPWRTDDCISCHDVSGNYADPLSNRVHAVHSENKTGDNHAIDWSEITYPQGGPSYNTATGVMTATGGLRCITCHTSTNTAYKSNVTSDACRGCHAGKPGAVDHFLQNGGK